MEDKKINLKVNLEAGTTLLPSVIKTEEGKEVCYIEGELHKNKFGRYEIDETYGLFDGSAVELKICGTWVKTKIGLVGNKNYYAVGLQGLPLKGITARIQVRTNEDRT